MEQCASEITKDSNVKAIFGLLAFIGTASHSVSFIKKHFDQSKTYITTHVRVWAKDPPITVHVRLLVPEEAPRYLML
jgi:hypothetical protein